MTLHCDDLLTCAIIALACSGIAVSFTQGSMFEGLRAWIMRKNKLLGDLAKCFFCLSHWLAFAAIAIYQPRPLRSQLLADFVISAFVTVSISTLISGLIFTAFFMAGQFHALRERMLQTRPPSPT